MNSFIQSTVTNSVSHSSINHFGRQEHSYPTYGSTYSGGNKLMSSAAGIQSAAICSSVQAAPITEFNLADMGIDQARFIDDIVPGFSELKLDGYEKRRQEAAYLKGHFPEHLAQLEKFQFDHMCLKASLADVAHLTSQLTEAQKGELEKIGAVRFRAIAKFEVSFNNNTPSPRIKRVLASGFVQMTSAKADFRAMPRYFEEASDDLTDDIEIRQMLRFVASKVRSQHASAIQCMFITLHQVSVKVDAATPFHLPDGIHQDGADYIVSAIPVIMSGVNAPLSTIYDANLRPVLETKLGVGQGLLHDDRNYWHSVSDLHASGAAGQRSTIGLDVQLAG